MRKKSSSDVLWNWAEWGVYGELLRDTPQIIHEVSTMLVNVDVSSLRPILQAATDSLFTVSERLGHAVPPREVEAEHTTARNALLDWIRSLVEAKVLLMRLSREPQAGERIATIFEAAGAAHIKLTHALEQINETYRVEFAK